MPQLAKLIRDKYPGTYDDLGDDVLENSILAKHPEYKDLATPPKNEPGNIDLAKQPKVPNPEGGISTVFSRSYNLDGKETLLPSVTPDGRFLKTDNEVINEYKKTGRHLGKFDSVDEANKYAEQLHKDYESGKYEPRKTKADEIQLKSEQYTPEETKPIEQKKPINKDITREDTSMFSFDPRGMNEWIANKASLLPEGLRKPAAFLGTALTNIPADFAQAILGAPEAPAIGMASGAMRANAPHTVPEIPRGNLGRIAETVKSPEIPREISISRNIPKEATFEDTLANFGGAGHPESPNYVSNVLKKAGSGEPGLAFEEKEGLRHVVYRDKNGEPIAAARVVQDQNGKNMVMDLAADKSKGLLTGRAMKHISSKLEELGATEPAGTISADAQNFLDRMKNKQSTREDIIPSPLPEYTPVGGEAGYNQRFTQQVTPGANEEQLFNQARNKFGMGLERPEEFNPSSLKGLETTAKPQISAEYAFDWPEAGGPQFNIRGGELDGSTVGLAKVKSLGLEVPEIPANSVRKSGAQLREEALAKRNPIIESATEQPRESLLTGEKGELNIPGFGNKPKPRYRLDTETGMGIPIDEQGNQIGPAVSPSGQSIRPELAQMSKYNNAAKMANESQKKSLYAELRDANRTILTAFDFSAPGRQGKPLMLNKEYWTSFDDMFKSWGSQRAYDLVKDSIHSHPNFTRPMFNGKELPSIAERAGLNIGGREEFFNSKLAEHIPIVGRSERAYNAFLGKLRSDTFNRMISDAEDMGLNPKQNDVLLKKYASFINDATGRGSLGRLEKAAPLLNEAFFAPRLMASRVNMYKRVLNPMTYVNEDPVLRKQTIKSLIALVGFGNLVGQTAKLAGAKVSGDPYSSDFGKIRIGNTRIDPFAGFQQYAVGASRLISGKTTSSTTGKQFDLTSGRFGMPTRASVVSNFMTNKLAPIPSFVWSWLSNKEFDGMPFNAKQAIANRTIPIVMQDLYDIYQEDPKKFPPGIFKAYPTATKGVMGMLPVFGEGIQTYGR
jgi:hypothetical protein